MHLQITLTKCGSDRLDTMAVAKAEGYFVGRGRTDEDAIGNLFYVNRSKLGIEISTDDRRTNVG